MKVYLDDAEIAVEDGTLSSALAAGTSRSERDGRIIVEVWSDGSPTPAEHLSKPPGDEPYAEEIRLVSAEPRSLVQTVLLDVAEALSTARQMQQKSADLLQTGETGPALTELGQAINTWQTVRQAVEEGCALLHISLDPVAGEAEIFDPTIITDLAELLTSVKGALTQEDWPLLSDLLAYDMDEHIDRWRTELGRLSDSIAASP